MRSSTGRWVSGGDFFDRESELQVLENRVRDGNHVLLTGQRRMGKTSIARELGRRLEAESRVFLFADVEGATCAEDAIADIARAVHPVRPIMSHVARAGTAMKRLFDDGHRFPSRLLKDWWSARFRDHHRPLEGRRPGDEPPGDVQ